MMILWLGLEGVLKGLSSLGWKDPGLDGVKKLTVEDLDERILE
jgi:hypothetical protein